MTTLTAPEAAKLIGISPASFRRAVDRGELPGPSIRGRPYRWSWAAIERALANPTPSDAPLSIDEELMGRIYGMDPNEIR